MNCHQLKGSLHTEKFLFSILFRWDCVRIDKECPFCQAGKVQDACFLIWQGTDWLFYSFSRRWENSILGKEY